MVWNDVDDPVNRLSHHSARPTSPHSAIFFSITCYTSLFDHSNLNLIPLVLDLGTSVIA